MHVEWHGQSAFTLTGNGTQGLHRPVRRHVRTCRTAGSKFDYPPIERGRRRPPADHPRARRPQRGRGDRRRAGDPARHRGHAGVADRRGDRRSPRSTTTPPAPSAARTRSSPSTSTASASPTSATSASASCGPSRPRPSRAPSCSCSPSAAVRRSARSGRRGHRRGARAALGGADALPHAANRLPRDRGGVRRRMPRVERLQRERLRHHGAARGGGHARRRPGRALSAPLWQAARGVVRRLRQPLDDLRELLEALVGLAVLAGGVAGVDALEDDRQLPEAEGDEEVDLAEVAARALRVALAARRRAWGSPARSSPARTGA